ncbi:MAG: ATP-binding protein, partial [Acidobacteria bacterium]|nr:ATP-binding protein [Acidobacteriota bacterium]
LQDVSHELRTPLSRLGFAIELARTSTDREASLARIRKEVDRLSALVGQLLQVTRAEGDPGSRELEEISLDALLAEVAEDAAWEAEIRHVRITCRVAEAVHVLGDTELLRRAVENVVRNAIRYAPDNSTVELTLARDQGRAVIRVRDQGPGVAEQHLTEIFKPFFREDISRTGSTGGVGLGLAIVSRAINLHHGTVRAENAQPGLMIEIELPAAA